MAKRNTDSKISSDEQAPVASDICRQEVPALREISPGTQAACHQV
ncbi:hypothetical protein [Paenibacillus rhizophilus]|nr:hypothetical protein [Paenibacillus rhizophilus]